MLEAAVEGFFYALGEILAYTLWPLLYYSGWLVLKVITFGNYPPKSDPMSFNPNNHSKVFVRFVGFFTWCCIGYVVFKYVL